MKKRAMKKYIPKGQYCYNYDGKKPICCKWLTYSSKHDEQNSGYCKYLKYGDWFDDNLTLLWDECKECNIKNYD